MTAREPATRRGRCPLREGGPRDAGSRGRARRQDVPDSGREKGGLMRIRTAGSRSLAWIGRAPAP